MRVRNIPPATVPAVNVQRAPRMDFSLEKADKMSMTEILEQAAESMKQLTEAQKNLKEDIVRVLTLKRALIEKSGRNVNFVNVKRLRDPKKTDSVQVLLAKRIFDLVEGSEDFRDQVHQSMVMYEDAEKSLAKKISTSDPGAVDDLKNLSSSKEGSLQAVILDDLGSSRRIGSDPLEFSDSSSLPPAMRNNTSFWNPRQSSPDVTTFVDIGSSNHARGTENNTENFTYKNFDVHQVASIVDQIVRESIIPSKLSAMKNTTFHFTHSNQPAPAATSPPDTSSSNNVRGTENSDGSKDSNGTVSPTTGKEHHEEPPAENLTIHLDAALKKVDEKHAEWKSCFLKNGRTFEYEVDLIQNALKKLNQAHFAVVKRTEESKSNDKIMAHLDDALKVLDKVGGEANKTLKEFVGSQDMNKQLYVWARTGIKRLTPDNVPSMEYDVASARTQKPDPQGLTTEVAESVQECMNEITELKTADQIRSGGLNHKEMDDLRDLIKQVRAIVLKEPATITKSSTNEM
ncbi:hypothetical protein G7Y89_g11786 [Cudoniella acicularis]|uniref:Uncharacterized protein n=1 Tax=Cudoniella acicularis TaxID=354080 RepID=A0A8H4RBQ5_9HELO|nr:hypothetical protein G7Y89_g11786 [Cudoniella acicularis]